MIRLILRKGYRHKVSVLKWVATVYICGLVALILTTANTEFVMMWEISNTKGKQLRFYDGFNYPLDINMVEHAHKNLRGERNNVSIINPHPFIYLQNPTSLCSKKRRHRPLRLMILVKSAVQYYKLRSVIRNTWGNRLLRDAQDIQYAFLLGYVPGLQDIIDIEQQMYQDIIQENFYDAYRNNTYKTIMGFNWIVEYCNQAHYVLFLDDDMYLNVNMLKEYLNDLEVSKTKHVFTGILAHESPPVRDVRSKHFVSLSEYPYDIYPDYLAGSYILTSIDVIKMFQSVFPYVKYLPIDDSYLGIVAKKLNIIPTENLLVENQFSNGIDKISHLIALHGFRDQELYSSSYNKMGYG